MQEENRPFELVSDYQPTGDQPQAIHTLAQGVLSGDKEQTLLGVTGSGKTFTMANVIKEVRPSYAGAGAQQDPGRPALLASSRRFFHDNAVEYFVSATTTTTSPKPTSPTTDTYIEKD